jgi:hypothetical protein
MRPLLFMMLVLPNLASAAAQPKCPAPQTHIEIAQGDYSPQPGTVFNLHEFAANMVSRGKSAPLCYQRWTEVARGDVFVTAESLTKLFEQKVKKADTAISDIKIETKNDNTVHLSGKMKKVIPIPFSIEGPVSTDGHTLILQAKSIKAVGIPMKGLLDALGKELSSIVHSESVNGVAVKGDTLIFQPEQISHVRGHIAKLEVTDKGLAVQFGEEKQQKTQARLHTPK